MHTSMKTWRFLSNYKGVCSVLLWGCPAALLTLWGLCFSHFLRPNSSFSLPLSFSSASVHLLIPIPFPPLIWCLVFICLLLTSSFAFIRSSFFSPFWCFILPPPTHFASLSVSRIVPPFGFGLFCGVKRFVACSAQIVWVNGCLLYNNSQWYIFNAVLLFNKGF